MSSPHDQNPEQSCENMTHIDLVSQGWERRSMLSDDRVKEATETYLELGFEVLVRDLSEEKFGPKCGACQTYACSNYILIYTRREDK